MDGQRSSRWTLTYEHVCLSVCDCCPSVGAVKSPSFFALSLWPTCSMVNTESPSNPRECAFVCVCFCVSVFMCHSVLGWVLGGQTCTSRFSWSHQWIVNTVLTITGRPLATTYWIRYVISDRASIWNPFVMQYSSVFYMKVRTWSGVIQGS